MRGNLFVVSRVGQLRNAQTFIKQYGATHNHLAVLYTETNLVLLDNIAANVEEGLFEDTFHIRQPLKPTTQTRRKNTIIYNQIDELLLMMTNERDVGTLYLCNSDNYYSLFERVNQVRGLGLKLSLLEEGLTTYAHAGKRFYAKDTTVDWAEVKHRGRHLRRVTRQAARSLFTVLITLTSFVLRVDAVQFVKDVLANVFVSKRYRFGTIRHFDDAYVYFPDRIYSNNIQVDNVHKLDFVLEHSASQELLDAVEDDAVIFVSQKYVDPYAYFSIVFEVLSEMGLERVLFKFHPREDRASFARAWDNALREHPRLQVVSPPEIHAIPVEELMMAGKTKQIIGLTSTSLMYAKALFPDVDVVSIGVRFRELADSDEYDLSKRSLAEFNRDLDVFLDVSDVRQF